MSFTSNMRQACVAAALTLVLAQPAAAQTRSFDIPAQQMSAAISEFGRQAGIQIVAPADGLEGLQSQPLQGSLDARAALHRLIEGTQLVIASDTGAVIVLHRVTSPATPDTATLELETVLVTAQKREEAAQSVPISLSAFSAKTLNTYRIETLRDVSRLTPGLLVSAFNQSSPTIAVRGATNTFSQIGANKPVAVVVDDLFIPRNSAAIFELYGLNSIQVLRGPQGTLFGRNVTGGAIVLDTGKPAFGMSAASARAGAGNYDLRQADGMIDLPAGDALAVRLAASLKRHDGYGRDRLTQLEEDDLDSQSVRGQVRLQAADSVEMLLGADYSDDRNGGRTLSSKTAGSDGDRRTSELGYPQHFGRHQFGGSLRVHWDTPTGKLSSISGYRHSESSEDYSGVGASYVFLTGTNSQTVNLDADDVGVFSQEIRFASHEWDWGNAVAGVYLSNEDARRRLRTRNLAAVTGAVSSDVLTDQAVKTLSRAAFVDGVVHLPAQLALTLGVRYTHDEKRATLVRTDFIRPASGFSAYGLERDWSEWTPRVVLSWAPRDEFRVYASATRGYTAGGFNTDASSLAALTTPFDPETVSSYELGLKSQWLDNRLRFNTSLFRMDYRDKQELFFNSLTRIVTITNASDATVKGLEAEISYRPAAWLDLSATYGLLDTVYDDFIIPGGANNTGNPLGSSPRNKGSLSADTHLPIGRFGYLTGAVSYAYTDGYYTGATKDPNLRVNAYGLTNLSLGYETLKGAVGVTAWVKNLTDADYILTPSTQGVLAEYLGEPRTWGVTISMKL